MRGFRYRASDTPDETFPGVVRPGKLFFFCPEILYSKEKSINGRKTAKKGDFSSIAGPLAAKSDTDGLLGPLNSLAKSLCHFMGGGVKGRKCTKNINFSRFLVLTLVSYYFSLKGARRACTRPAGCLATLASSAGLSSGPALLDGCVLVSC